MCIRDRSIGAGLSCLEVEDGLGLKCVLGDVDVDRAGAAGDGDLEGVAEGGGEVFGFRDEEVVLGDGQRDACDVDFLKCVGAENFGGNVGGDGDHGNGVEHRRGDAGDEIGSAGAAGGEADTGLAGSAGVTVGHVGRALLVADEHVMDGELAEGVVGGENGSAGITEDGGYCLLYTSRCV